MEKQETTEKCTVGTPVGNLVLEPTPEDIVSINPPKITEIRIQIGDDYASYKDCASLQEFLDNVKEYASLRKALDVAMECMQKCKTRDHIGAVCRTPEFVEEYERKISEIMKG